MQPICLGAIEKGPIPPMALKELEAKRAKPADRACKLTDGESLFLLAQPNGTKLWRMKYRFDGKEKLLSFGAYPDVTIAHARGELPAVHYIPRKDVDMAALTRSETQTYCPYKGDASYFGIPVGGARSADAIWIYEASFDAVAEIVEHLPAKDASGHHVLIVRSMCF